MRAHYRTAPFPSLAARRAQLDALEAAIRSSRTALRAAHADFRKPADETDVTESVVTLAELRHARKKFGTWLKPQKADVPLSLFGSKAEVRYEPKGVVLILAPTS